MNQEEVLKAIEDLRNSVSKCNPDAIILASTASMKNTSLFYHDKINNWTFNKNGSDIAILSAEYINKCKCASK